MNKRTKIASTRVTEEAFATLERLAEKDETTVAHLVRKAVTAYIRENDVVVAQAPEMNGGL